jgi:methionyl-tRNA formyltransferase
MEHFFEKGRIVDTYEGCPLYYTDVRDVSSVENVNRMKELHPDVIAVCACSILKKSLLDVPPLGTLNLHTGLAPYYRGCSCYFWPLYNSELEYLGVTVHYVTPGIDDGAIVHQGRPTLEANDDENTIFVKLMKLGTQLMIKSLEEIQNGTVRSHEQNERGRLYLDSATTTGHFRELHNRLKKGLIKEYLARQARNPNLPEIIE